MRVSVVSGGGGGIGRAIAAALSGPGSAVVVVDRDAGAARDTLAAVEAAGGRGAAVAADVTRSSDVAGYVETARAFTGRIDVLVNSAGVEGVVAPLGD
jgi:NAD(P)-dependent dehydrogenase (short-subunit alcohol dehydrogenase family)